MFHIVQDFENQVADFFGSPYAIATDCCTHAIELCLRLTQANNVSCPEWTYPSVPFTFIKLSLNWHWVDQKWTEQYTIGNTNIIDAATLWKQNSYQPGYMMCISFQHQKHLSLGRGGMILLDNQSDYQALSKMRYDGRDVMQSWYKQQISTIGYHYYMTPETAQKGLNCLQDAILQQPRIWSWKDYRYLPELEVFK